ncbi:MAG TPA: hypothetical protein VF427_05740 [Noviherbaspirillum sp.]
MPSSIGTVGQLVSVIRAQLASRSEISSRRKHATSGKASRKTSAYHQANLESLIAQRIQGIERDDPQRGRKAFRVFLESVLLSHFGEQLINDPKFYQLIDDIQMSMEADPDIRNLVGSAIDHLISASS